MILGFSTLSLISTFFNNHLQFWFILRTESAEDLNSLESQVTKVPSASPTNQNITDYYPKGKKNT